MQNGCSSSVDTFLTHPLLYTRVQVDESTFAWSPLPRVLATLQRLNAETLHDAPSGAAWREQLRSRDAIAPVDVSYFPRRKDLRTDGDSQVAHARSPQAAFRRRAFAVEQAHCPPCCACRLTFSVRKADEVADDGDDDAGSRFVDGVDWEAVSEKVDCWAVARNMRVLATSLGVLRPESEHRALQVIDCVMESNTHDFIACIFPSQTRTKPTKDMYAYMQGLTGGCAARYFFHPRSVILNVPAEPADAITCWKCEDMIL